MRENQPAICALHKGITRGLLDVLEPEAKLSAFVPHDPDNAGCLVELRGLGTPHNEPFTAGAAAFDGPAAAPSALRDRFSLAAPRRRPTTGRLNGATGGSLS